MLEVFDSILVLILYSNNLTLPIFLLTLFLKLFSSMVILPRTGVVMCNKCRS